MSEADALLYAIRAEPDEDAPRLVYADWLEENGEAERGEFIRLQVQGARLPRGSEEALDRERRAAVLLLKHGKEWFGSLAEDFDGCDIERGFVKQLRGYAHVYREHSAAIERHAPVLDTARVWHVEDDARQVLSLPCFRHIRRVSLDGVSAASLEALTGFTPPAGLADITYYCDRTGDSDTALRFADTQAARAPARVGLFFNFMPQGYDSPWDEVEAGARHNVRLLEKLDLPNLRAFGLWGVIDEVAEALADWPGLARLEDLLFGLSWMEDSALPILLSSRHLPDIKMAFLDENFLGDEAAPAIASCPKFATATYLDLSENHIGDAGATALANSPYLSRLTMIDLRANRISVPVQERMREQLRRQLGDRAEVNV